jgi:hypothetical protein
MLARRLRPSSSLFSASCLLRAATALRKPSGVIPRASAILVAQNGLGTRAPDKNRERLERSIPSKRCNTGMSTDTPPRTTVCLGLVVMQRVGPGTYMDESARLTRLFGLMEGM